MCPADVEFRKDCGYPGISANECAKRKCCFKSKPPGVPWCFFRINVEEGKNKYWFCPFDECNNLLQETHAKILSGIEYSIAFYCEQNSSFNCICLQQLRIKMMHVHLFFRSMFFPVSQFMICQEFFGGFFLSYYWGKGNYFYYLLSFLYYLKSVLELMLQFGQRFPSQNDRTQCHQF